MRSTNRIAIGIGLGVAAAFVSVALFGERMTAVAWIGHFFLNALFLLIIPLIVSSMVVGISGLGDIRRLGRIGGMTLLYYAVTTGIAVGIGILLVNWIQPGLGLSSAGLPVADRVAAKADIGWSDLILSLVSFEGKPASIVKSMSEMNILPVVLFSLLFGAALTTIGEKGKPVIALFDGIEQGIMKMVHALMWIAPLGVFGMVASRFAAAGDLPTLLEGLGLYVGTVLLGLAIHGGLVLPLILKFFGRRGPLDYSFRMSAALLTAFSTASSSATLPLTMQCAEKNAGVSRKAAGFVLPIGSTVNMDGTALYEAVTAIFIAQAFGVHLTPVHQIIVFLTATVAAVGAAGIPEAGLVTMVIVLKAVGLPLEGIGLILAVDWFLDRFRTTVNVWGDAVGAGVVDRFLPTEPSGTMNSGQS